MSEEYVRPRRSVPPEQARRKRKKKKRVNYPKLIMMIVAAVLILTVFVVGMVIAVKKIIPTAETMELTEYFELVDENQCAVIINGEYKNVPSKSDGILAIYDGSEVYLELGFIKEYIDDGYVYDSTEGVLRYATESQIYTANLGSSDYMIDKSVNSFGRDIIKIQDERCFLSIQFIQMLSDVNYTYHGGPSRVVLETPGYTKQVAALRRKVALRRFGGNKSKILEKGVKGEGVVVLEDYGKWMLVLSDEGVLGCVRGNCLTDAQEEVVSANHPPRNFNHILLDKTISLAWHQTMNSTANAEIGNVLSEIGNVNVMCPTWYYISDNNGNIHSVSSTSYVNECHSRGIQVWGLVSNLEEATIDTTAVLNTTSSRDNLVNNLIAEAITTGLDGINVDFESLSASAGDGFIQFIKELSIKCEKNDIILSVDNYVPSGYTQFYKRNVQADYADYICIMAYDEHTRNSEEAGSVASLPWVKEGVANSLLEVPANQLILGIPFYCRVWSHNGSGELIDSDTYGVRSVLNYIADNGAATAWDDATGQNYCEFTKGDNIYKIWVEDADSIDAKMAVMKNNNLAGAGYWKLGFENDAVWNTIAKYIPN